MRSPIPVVDVQIAAENMARKILTLLEEPLHRVIDQVRQAAAESIDAIETKLALQEERLAADEKMIASLLARIVMLEDEGAER